MQLMNAHYASSKQEGLTPCLLLCIAAQIAFSGELSLPYGNPLLSQISNYFSAFTQMWKYEYHQCKHFKHDSFPISYKILGLESTQLTAHTWRLRLQESKGAHRTQRPCIESQCLHSLQELANFSIKCQIM